MTKKSQLECDGCGLIEVVEQGSVPSQIKEAVAVSLKAGADQMFDLCFPCEKRLTQYTNPRSWPRAGEPGGSYEIGSGGEVPRDTA